MQSFIILSLIAIVWCTNYHIRKSTECKKSYECSKAKPCCRDADGHALAGQQHFGKHKSSSQSGRCSSLLGKERAICDSACGCESGYKCYRPMSGVCCPPMRCYNATWVEQRQRYWANCRPPTCFFPR
ncbi:uncharacterized protein LOC127714989 [Mytilus californianus]|uniref:uncharacterized protein LOC127714989 n=1 Tax=Mytilus californianus TaxID=6549 RepID=UPI002248712B|nr:uncharacterized protein LOC127714989 [Mytilus californianus]